MSCDLEVTNKSACCWEEISSYITKIDIHWYRWPLSMAASKQDLYLFGQMLPFLPYPFFRQQNSLYSCVGQEAEAVKRKSESEGENKVGRDGNRSFCLRSVRLRLICQFACMCENRMQAPWKAILWGKKTQLLEMNNYLCWHLISRKEKMWVKK